MRLHLLLKCLDDQRQIVGARDAGDPTQSIKDNLPGGERRSYDPGNVILLGQMRASHRRVHLGEGLIQPRGSGAYASD